MSVLTELNYRHSAGKLNKFRNDPQGYVAEQIFNIKSKPNDKMKRGNVTEEIARFILHRDPDDEQILSYAQKKSKEYGIEDIENVGWSILCARNMAEELESRQLKRPKIYQEEFKQHLPSFKYYSLGYGDFTYDNITVDLKSKDRMPNYGKAEFSHILQQSYYWGMSGKNRRFALLYGTTKKTLFIEIPQKELADGWEIMLNHMRCIEHYDDICNTRQDWLNMFPFPDTNTFYYSDENYKEEIINLYKGAYNENN